MPRPVGETRGARSPVRLLLADVDGTLVTQEKVLTDAAVAAVHELHGAGVLFAITSGRPPRGMAMLVDPLALETPIAAFNGGLIVGRDMEVMETKAIPEDLVGPAVETISSFGLSPWVYRHSDWYILDSNGPHVDREAATVGFAPTVTETFDGLSDGVAKVVGVSDDQVAMDRATSAVRDRMGEHVSAAQSQPYYLDITHPDANKGSVAKFMSARYDVPLEQIATIGDMANDVLMFAHSGLSIAMGNASPEVQRAARKVTSTNEDEGFATAVHRFVLPLSA